MVGVPVSFTYLLKHLLLCEEEKCVKMCKVHLVHCLVVQ